MFAIIAPDILCHTLNTAPGIVANGYWANAVAARDVAKPEFYIPTSIATAFLLAKFIPNTLLAKKPVAYPRLL